MQLKNQQDEVDQVMREKNESMDTCIQQILDLRDRDLQPYVVLESSLTVNELQMLNIMAMVLEKDVMVHEFDPDLHGELMANHEELAHLLEDRADYNYDDNILRKLKDFVSKYTIGDFPQKGPSKILFQFISDLYRKLNVRNTMSAQFQSINEIKQSIDSNTFSINYSE